MRGERKTWKNSAFVIARGLHPLMMIGDGGGCHLCIRPIDAWVEEWRRMNRSKPSERSVVEEITSQLPGLTDSGLRAIQPEIKIAVANLRSGRSTKEAKRGTGIVKNALLRNHFQWTVPTLGSS